MVSPIHRADIVALLILCSEPSDFRAYNLIHRDIRSRYARLPYRTPRYLCAYSYGLSVGWA